MRNQLEEKVNYFNLIKIIELLIIYCILNSDLYVCTHM